MAALRNSIESAVASAAAGVDVRAGTVWIKDAAVLGDRIETLRTAPPVVEAVAELLGPGPLPVGALMRNPVGPTAQQALHVDWAGPVAPGHDQQAQAMFFLDDVTADNGPTRLVPGSHRPGRSRRRTSPTLTPGTATRSASPAPRATSWCSARTSGTAARRTPRAGRAG